MFYCITFYFCSIIKRGNQPIFSVPKKDIGPISHVILGLVEVAAVVQSSRPVDGRPVEVLLVVGWELCRAERRGLCPACAQVLRKQACVAVLKTFLLHIFQFIKPIYLINIICVLGRGKELRISSAEFFGSRPADPLTLIKRGLVLAESAHNLLLLGGGLITCVNALAVHSVGAVEEPMIARVLLDILPPRQTPSAWH